MPSTKIGISWPGDHRSKAMPPTIGIRPPTFGRMQNPWNMTDASSVSL